jgi:hypothetical protein
MTEEHREEEHRDEERREEHEHEHEHEHEFAKYCKALSIEDLREHHLRGPSEDELTKWKLQDHEWYTHLRHELAERGEV